MDINENIDSSALCISTTLYDCASTSVSRGNPVGTFVDDDQSRWERLMEENDQAKPWSAIDWKGQIMEDPSSLDSKPSDEQFKEYFEQIFNLLDPIMPDEVQNQIKRLKSNKASGPDGLPLGLFKALPFEWIMLIATLFNRIYPISTLPEHIHSTIPFPRQNYW